MYSAEPLEPYHHVRWVWLRKHNPSELSQNLDQAFHPTLKRYSEEKDYKYDIVSFKGIKWEVWIKADTVGAFLSEYRAVLYQKVRERFTRKDLALRNRVLKLYPRRSSGPFPWSVSEEPAFETE